MSFASVQHRASRMKRCKRGIGKMFCQLFGEEIGCTFWEASLYGAPDQQADLGVGTGVGSDFIKYLVGAYGCFGIEAKCCTHQFVHVIVFEGLEP
jgi:hypothetical protein